MRLLICESMFEKYIVYICKHVVISYLETESAMLFFQIECKLQMEKNYLITGGANGIGLEYTRMALRSGGRVVMTDINTSLGEQREKELQVSVIQ